jgi:Protein of unknown function (DUF2442)
MNELPRIASAEVIIHGVLKVIFKDGYEGVVDLRPLIAKRGVFEWLRAPKHFERLTVDEYGHSLGWIDNKGYEIDLGADGLRRDCERQAEIHKLMVV